MGWLVLLFILTPVVELWILIEIGSAIGPMPTVGLVLLTGMVGAWLARREGLKTFQEYLRMSQQGVVPAQSILDGMTIFLGGALLLTPGIVTDIVGFSLLFPVSRRLIQRWLIRRVAGRIDVQMHAAAPAPPPRPPPPSGDERIIDASFED